MTVTQRKGFSASLLGEEIDYGPYTAFGEITYHVLERDLGLTTAENVMEKLRGVACLAKRARSRSP